MRKAAALAAAIGLVLCMGLVTAAPAMAETGTIEGRVLEPTEAEGVAEIEVCAEPVELALTGGCAVSEDGSGAGPRGHYEIPGLEKGNYHVHFQPPVGSEFVPQYFPHKRKAEAAQRVEVEEGEIKGHVDAILDIGGVVAGKVTDSSGLPLGGVEACVFLERNPTSAGCGKSQANGVYSVGGLEAGLYTASFSDPASPNLFSQFFSGKASLAEADQFLVMTFEETSGIDAQMEMGSEITGTVVEAGTNTPLAGVRVCALGPSSEAEAGCAQSGADGTYSLFGLHAGTYVVAFSVTGEEGGQPVSDQEDGYVRQYFEDESSFAAANPVDATQPGIYNDIDAHLTKGPEIFPRPSSGSGGASLPGPAVAATPIVAPRRPRCRKHYKVKTIKGKRRCVKIHKAHRRRHHGGS